MKRYFSFFTLFVFIVTTSSSYASLIDYQTGRFTVEKRIHYHEIVSDSGSLNGPADDELSLRFFDIIRDDDLPRFAGLSNSDIYSNLVGEVSLTAQSKVYVSGSATSGTYYAHDHEIFGNAFPVVSRDSDNEFLREMRSNTLNVGLNTIEFDQNHVNASVTATSRIHSGFDELGDSGSFRRAMSLDVDGYIRYSGDLIEPVPVPNNFFGADKDTAQSLATALGLANHVAVSINYGIDLAGGSVKNVLLTHTLNTIDELCNSKLSCSGESLATNLAFLGDSIAFAEDVLSPAKKVQILSGLTAVGTGLAETYFQDIADDPPDYNFTTIESHVYDPIEPLESVLLTDYEADLATDYINYQLQARDWLRVALVSLERYQGAAYSDNLEWAEKQLQRYVEAIDNYNAIAADAQLLYEEIVQIINALGVVDSIDVQNVNFTLQDILEGIEDGLFDDYFAEASQLFNFELEDFIADFTLFNVDAYQSLLDSDDFDLSVESLLFSSAGNSVLDPADDNTIDVSEPGSLTFVAFSLLFMVRRKVIRH